jgi:glycine cleavage system T protein (aminomethyltransferase)
MSDLKRTPLYEAHRALGARMVPFGGWEMPVQYTGILDEHRAVREAAGAFDVSHMGEIGFRGPRAAEAVQRLVTNAVSRLTDGGAMYTLMCYDDGGIVDDCIVYRLGDKDFLIVVNASNIEKDFDWMVSRAGAICEPRDDSGDTALIAVQGPRAPALISGLAGEPLAATVPSFRFATAELAGARCVVARTGYTGEDGFEVFCSPGDARRVWEAVLVAGAKPAGLGARDTLRLEARLPLYGNDIDATTTPLEAGLGWAVKLEGADFIGKPALLEQKAKGPTRRLIGFVVKGRGIARHDYPILDATGLPVGKVTSGTTAPTLGVAVGMGYVPAALAEPGTALQVDCRGKIVPVEVVKGPFYKRSKA